MDLILYHGKCTDGWVAAYIASKKYPSAQLIPQYFSTEAPYELVEGKDVLVVDFSWKSRATNIKLNLLAKSFRILDHHKSAEELLKDLDFATFDNSRSGAGMTWDYLFGKDSELVASVWEGNKTYLPRPWWVDYVEDYDIWNKKLENTEEINAYLHTLSHTADAWDFITTMDPGDAKAQVTKLGKGMIIQLQRYVKELVAASNHGRGWGLTIGFVNAPYFFASDVGHELAKTYDVGMTWWQRQDGLVTFGLRSIGDIDVSKIATKMGGGGHKNAAGFEVSMPYARDIIKDILSAND